MVAYISLFRYCASFWNAYEQGAQDDTCQGCPARCQVRARGLFAGNRYQAVDDFAGVVHVVEEFGERQLAGAGDPRERRIARVALPALDAPNVAVGVADHGAELLLRHGAVLVQLPHARTQGNEGMLRRCLLVGHAQNRMSDSAQREEL